MFGVRTVLSIERAYSGVMSRQIGQFASEQLPALVRLTLADGLGPVLIRRLLDECGGDVEQASRADPGLLRRVRGVGADGAERIAESLRQADPQAEMERAREAGVHLVCRHDPEYPPMLALIHDRPVLLYVRGELDPTRLLHSIAIVGSRRCSMYGRQQAGHLASGLSMSGFVIVSGGARGIDTAAHQGALTAGGPTVVVLGCGMEHVYPRENKALFDHIVETGGAIVTEFPMAMVPAAENFPRRNRIVSGMSLGTIVVEASTRSGALITARLACEDHNREVMAVPGRADSPTSAGCHKMIREGWARLVTTPAEVLESLEGAEHLVQAAIRDTKARLNGKDVVSGTRSAGPLFESIGSVGNDGDSVERQSRRSIREVGLSESQRAILDALTSEPIDSDELAHQCGLDVATLQADLTVLQLRGLVNRAPSAGVWKA